MFIGRQDFQVSLTISNILKFPHSCLASGTEHALKSKSVKDFILKDSTKFDLIISEQFFQEAVLMFAHKYKAPIVTISKLS